MHRHTHAPLYALAALAAAALAACQDQPLTAPAPSAARSAAPLAAKGGNAPSIEVGSTSVRNVTPAYYDGNTTKSDDALCPGGSTGTKVDDATAARIAGYDFTPTRDGTQLSFAPVGGGSPADAITAVIVKGGPGFDVYTYDAADATNGPAGAAVTSDAGLSSPRNRGGNIPTISHYLVCSTPVTTKFTKKLVHVFYTPAMDADDPEWLHSGMVDISDGRTRWLQYEIAYTLPTGVLGTVTEDRNAVCATAGAGVECSFNVQPYGASTYTFTLTQNTGSIHLMIDIINRGARCDRPFTNTAVLRTSTGAVFTASATVMLWPAACP